MISLNARLEAHITDEAEVNKKKLSISPLDNRLAIQALEKRRFV